MIAIIEIPQGSLLKYELDKTDNTLIVDRVLNQPIPYNYGYIPNTLCDDGDPLDVFVLGNIAIQPLSKVRIEVTGVIYCIDNGKKDDKLIAIISGDDQYKYSGDELVRKYLTTYKSGLEIVGHGGVSEALALVLDVRTIKTRM